MNKAYLFLKRNSSTILSIIGAVGTISTAVLAVKETPKAMKLIIEAQDEKGEELTFTEAVQVAWKPYIPAIMSCFGTISCIFLSNYLNAKSQASLMSAYALLDNTFKEYKKATGEIYGEDSNKKIELKMEENKLQTLVLDIDNDDVLFFDINSLMFFESSLHKVMQAECYILHKLKVWGTASLNDYYRVLGLPEQSYGDKLGWTSLEANDVYGYPELEFKYEKVTMSNGIECVNITTTIEPTPDFLDFCFGAESYEPVFDYYDDKNAE